MKQVSGSPFHTQKHLTKGYVSVGMLKSCAFIYSSNDGMDLSKIFVNQDVYHLSCYFNYMIINHLEYWNVYSWLITSFPNNVNKIPGEKVLNMHSFSLWMFTEHLHEWRVKPFSDKEGASLSPGSSSCTGEVCMPAVIIKLRCGKSTIKIGKKGIGSQWRSRHHLWMKVLLRLPECIIINYH